MKVSILIMNDLAKSYNAPAYATVHLSWTQVGNEQVCVGGHVSIICMTIGPGTLQWAIEPLFGFDDRIDMNVYEHSPGSVIDNPIPDITSVIIVRAEQDSSNPEIGNITSVITIKVTDSNIGRHVHCSDGRTRFEDSPLLAIPSACKSTIKTIIL